MLRTTKSIYIAILFLISPVAAAWNSETTVDEMTGKTTVSIEVTSGNEVDLKWPYGKMRGHLVARKHPRHGRDVYFYVDDGHILCHRSDNCAVLIKFDNNPPVRFSGNSPSDGSTNVIFIEGFDRLLKLSKKSKIAIVEVEFYKNGRPHFTFDISDIPPSFIASLK